jgi:hypothetical protein
LPPARISEDLKRSADNSEDQKLFVKREDPFSEAEARRPTPNHRYGAGTFSSDIRTEVSNDDRQNNQEAEE